MCLLVMAWRLHPRFRLVVAANRDEFHDRPAAPMSKWIPEASSVSSSPVLSGSAHDIIAGRDLRAGGTWLGLDDRGRFGVITNFRDLQKPRPGAPSRGMLIPAYLEQEDGPESFLRHLAPQAAAYSGFNLLLSDGDELSYASNRTEPFVQTLAPGVYGLSNHLLDTPWPKLLRVRQRFEKLLQREEGPPGLFTAELFAMLADREPAPRDPAAPPGLMPADLERALSAPFVLHPTYGTRCSSVVLQETGGTARIAERSFDATGDLSGEVMF